MLKRVKKNIFRNVKMPIKLLCTTKWSTQIKQVLQMQRGIFFNLYKKK